MTAVLSMLIALTAQVAGVAEQDAKAAGKRSPMIEIKPQKPTFALGAAMELRVVYSNPTDREWKLEQPESSGSVNVSFQLAGTSGQAVTRFSLSRKSAREVKLPNGRTQIVQTLPPKAEIEIKPGERHELVIDLSPRWTEELAPGQYEAWIDDLGQSLKSNKCTFSLAFSRDSVPELLATAAKEDESPAKRRWCARWLQKIKPDFGLELKGVKDSPETVKKISDDNTAAIQGFKAFWAKARDSREIEAFFASRESQSDPRRQPPPQRREDAP